MTRSQSNSGWTADTLFAGDDETAAAHRVTDWASTPLGPVESWPSELTAAVATVFASDVAMLLWLGPELVQVFNDAYTPILGVKYPYAVGQPAAECWPDVWAEMGPLAEDAVGGRTTRGTDVLLYMDRRGGLPEETYWTFSYSPVRGSDGDVLGVFVATRDVTRHVLSDRRMAAVQQIASISSTQSTHPVETLRAAVNSLSSFRADFPLLMAYVDPLVGSDEVGEHILGGADNAAVLENGRRFELVAVGDGTDADGMHRWIVGGPGLDGIAEVTNTGEAVHLRAPSSDILDSGPRAQGSPVEDVVVLPLRVAGRSDAVGVLVVGTSPFQIVDERHLSFLDVVASRLSTILTDVLAYEFERHRSAALAEVDAVKTRVLENVSHEFRTPLTLLLAPLRGLLDSVDDAHRDAVDVVYRNAIRLRRLVDSLLEVAGSAGALAIDREPTDIVELTRGCLAQFDGVVKASGLALTVESSPVAEIEMDREKWVRIITNLTANAINYTHRGGVRVSLGCEGPDLVLRVADTGIGLSEADRSRVFDRFYRVDDAVGRSAEGSGIGLALVSELVTALGGTVSVDSVFGEGSTFTVVVPIVDSSATSHPISPSIDILDSTHVLTPADSGVTQHRGARGGASRSVLLVEDNPDMRRYLVGLLTSQNWDVAAVGDIESALRHARESRPGLVLTDVMLPGRSGLELVRELRSDRSLVRVPVVLITARAGTESAVQGLEAGADDYVVKPFEPRELIARIRVHLELSAIREELLIASNDQATTLQDALVTRSTIGTAIGLLMASNNCDADTAFQQLTAISQNSNRKARDVAAEMVADFTRH